MAKKAKKAAKRKSAVKKSAKKSAVKVRVRKVFLPPKEVIRIKAHKGVHPAVVHKESGVIEVVAVHETRGGGWWDFFFKY